MELIYYLIFLDRDKMNVYRDKSVTRIFFSTTSVGQRADDEVTQQKGGSIQAGASEPEQNCQDPNN